MEIVTVSGSKSLGTLETSPDATLDDLKPEINKLSKKLIPSRQSLRIELKGKAPKQDATLKSLGVSNGSKIYIKDLGPQIGWKTVFLLEYAGPLFVYLWMYQRPWLFYGMANGPKSFATK